jgi:geranylgeranyl reductase family protein
MYDVIVIGSGVAGSAAAYKLAEAGKNILVLEKELLPRYKTCGGGVISKVGELLPYKIDPVVECKLYKSDIYDHANNLHFLIERDIPIINMTMREEFDYFMLSKAVSIGTEIKADKEVIDVIGKQEYVEVITPSENFRSKFVIAADGATGITTRKLGIQTKVKRIPAIEHEVIIEQNQLEKLNKTARFDFGLVPNGYAWVFPKKEHLSIGLLTMNKPGINLHQYLKKYYVILGITKVISEERHGYVIPLYSKLNKFVYGRIIIAGDTAGLSDPITAEGISYAITSGIHAASAIINGQGNKKGVGRIYEAEIQKTLNELKYARYLAFFIYKSSVLRSFVFKMYGEKLSNLMTDVITGKVKYSELLKNPVNYLKLFKLPAFSRNPR